MKPTPDWLEPLSKLEDFGGDVPKYLDHVFSIFKKDFIDTTPIFKGKRVLHNKKNENGRPQAFVHITTEENRTSKQREICLRRCERISWIKAIIEHSDDPLVLVWEKEQKTTERTAVRTYLFLEKEKFLVILQEIKYGHYMITAIYVDNPNQRRKHLKAYQEFKKISK
jgi:hypothetical protein